MKYLWTMIAKFVTLEELTVALRRLYDDIPYLIRRYINMQDGKKLYGKEVAIRVFKHE